ncbi:MAG: sulfatase [Planctomycetota bacterium]|nr:sulfatase [Planctomycetota bacterium]MED5447583.1 sulfatase [Planctomycetota bacterium]
MITRWRAGDGRGLVRLAVCGLAILAFFQSDRLAAAGRPNIILVITDDQRFDALGCMGNAVLKTPHIDGLAAQGALFTHTFCTTSICATSRASFLTGQYAMRHGIRSFRKSLTESQWKDAFPVLLRQAGYRTAMVGKWGLGGPLPRERYDVFNGFSGQGRYYSKPAGQGPHLTHRLGQQVLDFLETCDGDQPFLLQYYTKAAHCQDGDPWPFQPDHRYDKLFSGIQVPSPATATEAHFSRLPKFLQTSEARRRWKIRFANPAMYQKSVKDYYRLVVGVDDVIGRVVAKLKQKQLFENTVIIFTSDNGFYLGEHGLAGKWFMHEESIRLPLVICDPRLPEGRKGRRLGESALNIDIAPTILDLAGLEVPGSVQGRSLKPLLDGRRVEWRNEFFYEHPFQHPRIPKTEGVRGSRWKYVRYTSLDPVVEELYDLKEDSREERNLAGDPRFVDRLGDQRNKWREWRERVK